MNICANIRSEAAFSEDGKNRYWLSREWGWMAPYGIFLLINPSTADALLTDPTTNRCMEIAIRWGWRGFGIVNLSPEIGCPPPILLVSSVVNDDWIKIALAKADIFVVGTGEDGEEERKRVFKRLDIKEERVRIIGTNNSVPGFTHPGARDLQIPDRPLEFPRNRV
jgi:hypothetical protein